MNKPLVSVVIPCYNYGRFLQRSVESVVGQTYQQTEIIVIDDGSTDNTTAVVKKLQALYPEIRYIKQSNTGIIATRNKALGAAKGDYLVQLDADDYLDEDYIEKTLKIAQNTGADIVYTNYITFGDDTQNSNFPDYDLEKLKNSNFIHISSLMKVTSVAGYKFDKRLQGKTHEDWDFFLNLCLHGKKAVLCKDTFMHYRLHAGSRNNRLTSQDDQIHYAEMYTYIVSKYTKEFPEQFDYMIADNFANWYVDIAKSQRALAYECENVKHSLAHYQQQLSMIKASRVWKMRNKLAKLFGRSPI